jgi:hypothetical protein
MFRFGTFWHLFRVVSFPGTEMEFHHQTMEVYASNWEKNMVYLEIGIHGGFHKWD